MKKNTLILVASLLILVIAAYFVMQRPGATASRGGQRFAHEVQPVLDEERLL